MHNIWNKQKGFYLIEAVIAILVFAIGILGVIKIQANSINNVSDVQFRTTASGLSQSIINQILLDKNNISSYIDGTSDNYQNWLTQVKKSLPGVENNLPQITYESKSYGTNLKVIIFWNNPKTSHISNFTNETTIY